MAEPNRLSLFIDPALTPAPGEHVHFLTPFLGISPYHQWGPMSGAWDRWAAMAPSLIRLTGPEQADAAVLAGDWARYGRKGAIGRERARQFVVECIKRKLPTIVFHFDDCEKRPDLEGALLFRTSIRRSKRGATEFAQPAWSRDLISETPRGRPIDRLLGKVPVVSFCGMVPGRVDADAPNLRRQMVRVKNSMREVAVRLGLRAADGAIRRLAVERLAACRSIEANFVLRDGFLGYAARDATAERTEYVTNMLESDYVLCARGVGNYSWRLYEAMSLGRIPVIIDTECCLPVPGKIDWNSLAVVVSADRLDTLCERILSDHAAMDEARFAERQRACRDAWMRYLSPHGFFEQMVEWLNVPNHERTAFPFLEADTNSTVRSQR